MSAETQDAAVAAGRFAAAHRALLADGSVQLDLPPAAPPPAPPAWLKSLGEAIRRLLHPVARLLHWIGGFVPDAPYARILLWSVLALAAAGAVWMAVVRIRDGEWRLPRRRRAAVALDTADDEWTPGAAPARVLLGEADALAVDGRFAEAVHLLLIRSVDDIARRRPSLVRPALTSRDLAAADAIPGGARALFTGIARTVERSLFGGRAVGADDWATARAAYADFALSRAWRA